VPRANVQVDGPSTDMDHFVRVEDSQFSVNCKRFAISGFNMWEMVEAAAGGLELFGASLPPNTTGPALVRHMFDRAVANKFNVVRAWAHTVSPQYALQASRATVPRLWDCRGTDSPVVFPLVCVRSPRGSTTRIYSEGWTMRWTRRASGASG
jgi:hypothetical protein